jgi:hypothetical protein
MSLLNSSSRSAWCAMAARAIPDKHAPCPGLCYSARSAPIPDKSTCGRPRPLASQISHPLERNRRSVTQETRVYSAQIKNPSQYSNLRPPDNFLQSVPLPRFKARAHIRSRAVEE